MAPKQSLQANKLYASSFIQGGSISSNITICFNPFHTNGLFQYPLKISENQRFSDVFRGVQKETSGIKWVNVIRWFANL